jgi:hypothetical protein
VPRVEQLAGSDAQPYACAVSARPLSIPTVPPAYGLAALVLLIVALVYVRAIARRRRRSVRRRGPSRGMRSLSQRSEMRANEDPSTVMEQIQRTHSRGRMRDEPSQPQAPEREAVRRKR